MLTTMFRRENVLRRRHIIHWWWVHCSRLRGSPRHWTMDHLKEPKWQSRCGQRGDRVSSLQSYVLNHTLNTSKPILPRPKCCRLLLLAWQSSIDVAFDRFTRHPTCRSAGQWRDVDGLSACRPLMVINSMYHANRSTNYAPDFVESDGTIFKWDRINALCRSITWCTVPSRLWRHRWHHEMDSTLSCRVWSLCSYAVAERERERRCSYITANRYVTATNRSTHSNTAPLPS